MKRILYFIYLLPMSLVSAGYALWKCSEYLAKETMFQDLETQHYFKWKDRL